MKGAQQTTLRDAVAISGVGVHSGRPVTLTLNPADDDAGIVFQRVAADGSLEREIRADVRAVTATEFATVLGDASGPLCSTAEHLLAALRGLNVDNVVIEIDGPEVPIMDGSAAAFVDALDQAGLTSRALPRRYIEVLKTIRVGRGESLGELRPYEYGFRVEAEIQFDHPLIGKQAMALDIEPNSFRREIARARTFGFMKDVSKLWSAGFALGASFDNTLVISEDRVLNPEGLRFADEFVRHKILDALGDLALAGQPLLAAYKTVRGGHKLNHAVLSALMADTSAWRVVEAKPAVEAEPARRSRGHAEVAPAMAAAAYGPDVS
ncbi:MAG: UDP-3-O-acyl-N-acetylglucosamine deacetylase [Pseudolabrys sp.]|nr:UDP-3-O-acyl-N-acetylglucosamine deacetylase [Pseudolabrys sp.]MDP2295928.1 UDP-3-O-acyl-N-acetylglucosamine deacetylase [Pseudolabrys sp.]